MSKGFVMEYGTAKGMEAASFYGFADFDLDEDSQSHKRYSGQPGPVIATKEA